jgi:hypothetical protein
VLDKSNIYSYTETTAVSPINGAVAKPDLCRWPQLPFSPKDGTEGRAMTPNATPMLLDNTGRLEASETVRFGIDGHAYEIDLPARRASELRSMAARYVRVARKIPSAASPARRQEPQPGTQMDREQSGRIRSGAIQRGLVTSPRGRIPQNVADEATVPVAPVRSQPPGTAEPQPAVKGGAVPKPSSGSGTVRAAQDKPAATASMGAADADARGGEHDLTDHEKRELRTIADAAKPERNIVASRLRTKGLADRDTAGNWWLTDAGRRELASA